MENNYIGTGDSGKSAVIDPAVTAYNIAVAKSVGLTLTPDENGLISLNDLSSSDLVKLYAAHTAAGTVIAGMGKGK